jgi:endopeptidase La
MSDIISKNKRKLKIGKEKINNFKIGLLQYRYKYLSDQILRLEKHIETLYSNNMIDYIARNQYLNNLFVLSKNLNSSYNNFIMDRIDIMDRMHTIIGDVMELFHDVLADNKLIDNFLFENMMPILRKNQHLLPLIDEENEMISIINNCGYDNINDMLKLYNMMPFNLSNNMKQILNEINKIFIPIKSNIFEVANHDEEFFWRIPLMYSDHDVLELTRELWIKKINTGNESSNTEYLKIEGFFLNDVLSCYVKTSQLNYPIIQKIKTKLLFELNRSDQKNKIDSKFVKKFIRYDYLGNIYCMNVKQYIDHINTAYTHYIEATSASFVNVMKDFISKGSDIKNMYESIFLLLLGNDDNIDIAGLLLGLIKDKKNNSMILYNLICSRIPYYLLVKIKKSNQNIKSEVDKLKTLTTDDVDYKKQLIVNKNIPQNVKSLVLEKIEEMKSFNNEYYKQLTYVKHVLNYPWTSSKDDMFFSTLKDNTGKAKDYLNSIESKLKNLSYGHEEAKKVLLQTIGKWISNPTSMGTCFGLVGPPGVGKTLLAKSVSSALNIPFAEITLGGQNDGEILHGHGYTYSGSQPGLIIKKMVDMGSPRCILYFDELDKACSKHGSTNEITSILIHLTDPNMNKTFQDRFFQGIDFPLDKVIIIFSYNDASLVDPILLDRLKQINVGAYVVSDKIKIVKEFIIPEISASVGLEKESWIHMNDSLIEWIIENYTNEAGVRSIKRKIEQIFLSLNLDKLYNLNEFANNNMKEITKEMVIRILEPPKNDNVMIHSMPAIGIINGMYATSGGDGGIIPIQIFNNFSPNSNSYEIKLTGKQGDVMKESVYCSLTAAIDYIRRSNIMELSSKLDDYMIQHFKYGFHVHAPSTSTPKDGPSAGCAFTSAFISRILGRKIRNDIAMTGEIELTGKITKIGGLNFKLIGAKKAGVRLVFVPKENEKDLDELKTKYPNLIDSNFQTKYFDYIDDIINEILI